MTQSLFPFTHNEALPRSHIVATPLIEPAECVNCLHEKGKKS